jgi:hypothetical protein
VTSAGYSATPLTKKLGIKPGTLLATVHAPEAFGATLGSLPPEAEWRTRLSPGLDVVIAFYTSRAALAADWPKLTNAASPDGTIWVAWPKKASKVASDITEDVLREQLLPSGWVDNKVCAIDDTWSGLRFALRRALR